MLVIGPNRVFLALHRAGPALARRGRRGAGRAGRPGRPTSRVGGIDDEAAARVKGDARMVRRAGQGRPRPRAARCATTSSCRFGLATCASRWPRATASSQTARRRFRRHNAARRFVEREVFAALAAVGRRDRRRRARSATALRHTARCATRSSGCGRCSRRPSCCTTCSARGRCCASPVASGSTDDEVARCYRAAPADARTTCAWTDDDVALLDEARGAARPQAAPARPAEPRTTRSAPTATSSSTRRRTCRPCSCAWRPGGRSTAR